MVECKIKKSCPLIRGRCCSNKLHNGTVRLSSRKGFTCSARTYQLKRRILTRRSLVGVIFRWMPPLRIAFSLHASTWYFVLFNFGNAPLRSNLIAWHRLFQHTGSEGETSPLCYQVGISLKFTLILWQLMKWALKHIPFCSLKSERWV